MRKVLLACVFAFFALEGSSFANQAILSWDANTESDLAGYKIYYGTVSGFYAAAIDVGNRTTYTLYGLAPGYTYYFVAAAYNTAGAESGYSNEVSKAIASDGTLPQDATGFTATYVAATSSVRLSWVNPPDTDLKSVIVEYSVNGGPRIVIAELTARPGTSQTYLHPVTATGTYNYFLHSKDTSGNVTNTAIAQTRVEEESGPPAPSASSDSPSGGGCGMTKPPGRGGKTDASMLLLLLLSPLLWKRKQTAKAAPAYAGAAFLFILLSRSEPVAAHDGPVERVHQAILVQIGGRIT